MVFDNLGSDAECSGICFWEEFVGLLFWVNMYRALLSLMMQSLVKRGPRGPTDPWHTWQKARLRDILADDWQVWWLAAVGNVLLFLPCCTAFNVKSWL